MCGIAGIYLKNADCSYLSRKEVENTVDWLLCGIEHRGTHATGIAVQNASGEFTLEKSDMPAGKFIFWRKDIEIDPRVVLLHTRWATKGKPENLLNNHPIQYENVIAIHNGHISNDDELFKDEEVARIAEVDSEIIPALLQKYTFDNPKDALEKLSGGFAIAAFYSLTPGRLILAKGSTSPLFYLENSGMFVWASTKKVISDTMEFALDYEVKDTEISELHYGRYMVIEGENSSIEDFKPYFKQTTYTNSWNANDGKRTPAYSTNHAHRNYSDGWTNNQQNLYGRDQCDECFVWFSFKDLEKVGHEYFCEACEKKLFEWDSSGTRARKAEKKLSRKERKRLRKKKAREFQQSQQGQKTIVIPKKSEGIAEALDNEHWAVCQLVAEFYSTKTEFVDFLLFNDHEIDDYDDPNLQMMHEEMSAKYAEILEEVQHTTDAQIEAIAAGEANQCGVLPRHKDFPVGFGGGL